MVREGEKDGRRWGGGGSTSYMLAHGKAGVTSKSWLSLEATWKKNCCHTWPLLGRLSKKQKSGSPFKYSYILVFLASAVNSELTRQELAGVTVSGRLLSPIQLN